MKTLKVQFIPLLLLLPILTLAQTKDTTKVGIYITSIYDLSYDDNSFTVEYWMWRLNRNRQFKEYNLIEDANSKKIEKLFSSTDWKDQSENQLIQHAGDTLFWDYENFRSTIKHNYDITNYPFDEEILNIDLEATTYYDNWVKLQIDRKSSGRGDFDINGWNIGEMTIDSTFSVYPTNFGGPGDTIKHVYTGLSIKIPIKRKGTALFFKLFSGLFVAFVIALLSLRINIAEADGRFGVCVGALFAAIANMYIANSNLPMASQFTFIDKAHILTIFLILILFATSTFSLQYYKDDQIEKSRKIEIA